MSNGFALWKNDSRGVDWGVLSLDADGLLSLRGQAGTAQVSLDVSTSPYVDVFTTASWLCAVGGGDRQLILGRAQGPRLDVIAELERTDGLDRFDFEEHSLRFYDRPGHRQCVLSWEIGVALVDPSDGVVWAYMHHDVKQRLLRITSDTVELRGVDQAISVDLGDGSVQVRSLESSNHVDEATLAHWMRGIGR